jgi:hypothetical protein
MPITNVPGFWLFCAFLIFIFDGQKRLLHSCAKIRGSTTGSLVLFMVTVALFTVNKR